jgi:hypothetical protein
MINLSPTLLALAAIVVVILAFGAALAAELGLL